ncbi:MAG: ATP-grasp domain-containing protein [Candidatus Aureabacteria bacterium]|nr:ATP-grasp domain-containing protein [Candidatus Auribacterota bacterium]
MKIGITYNLKTDFKGLALAAEDALEEFDSEKTVDAIASAIVKIGHEAVKLGGGEQVIGKIKNEEPSLVFNIAEGVNGRAREAQIPALLELLKIPYTHSDPLTLALTLDKSMTKHVVKSCGVNTPDFLVVSDTAELKGDNLPGFPLIVKPAWEGSSKGIRTNSKVNNFDELETQVGWVFKNYPGQPVLIEQFIRGREITVGVIGNNPPRILGMMEIGFKENTKKDFIYSLEVKRDYEKLVKYTCPPGLDDKVAAKVEKMALSAYDCLHCKDIARMDFRIDEKANAYFIEINPLPGLSPDYSDLIIMSKKLGIEYEDIIRGIIENAVKRYNIGEKIESCTSV